MHYSLLIFEIVFATLVVSQMSCVRGGKGVVGVGRQAKGDHYNTDSGVVPSVGDGVVNNPQDRSTQPLAAIWHPTNSD